MRKCLIIQTAFLGDVILATALVEKLRLHYPDLTIDFLLRKGNETLVENNPHINRVLVWDKKNKKYRNLLRIIRAVKSSKYDLVVNLQRFGASGLIAGRSKAKEIVGFDKNPLSFLFDKKIEHKIGNGLHEVERNQKLIEAYTDAEFAKPRLYPGLADYEKVQNYVNDSLVCMAPASVWETKQLPKEKWVELINSPALVDMTIYLLGGPADKALNEEILSQAKHSKIENLAGKLSIMESVALIKAATMTYVNDSGPLHMASAVNAPVTAFFCSTIPGFGFGPLSDKSTIIETQQDLTCRPCGLHGKKACPLEHFNCGYQIDIPETIV